MERSLQRYAWLSIGAAVVTIGLKGGAYWLTGSVGVLSDALESIVNLSAAIFVLFALAVAARPADEDHAYGHSKAEYLSSGFEGALILLAAGSILFAAVRRLVDPRPIDDVGPGLAIVAAASLVNLVVARYLLRAGKRHDSIALEADARHLMTDVWTSAGVIGGVGAVALTGWERLDPIVAIAVALHILRSGTDLLRRTAVGVLDTALPPHERRAIAEVLRSHAEEGVDYHAVRTRQAGSRRFVSFHVLVPGDWTVQRGHDFLERIEGEIRRTIPNATVFTHLEPVEDPASWQDTRLERGSRPEGEEEDRPRS